MNRCSRTVAVLALTGFLLVACLGPRIPNPENEVLMASLPVYPGATVVQRYVTDYSYSLSPISKNSLTFLWHVYATPDDGEAVRAFYKQNLTDWALSFDLGEGNDPLLGRFYGDANAEVDVFVWDHEMPPKPEKRQAPTPPPGTATLFTVRVFHWAGPGLITPDLPSPP
jgi:hypothetical protein